ncbi:MAG: DUF1643 domain-containing protein [Gammaproteobacteria bacterium]|nr:DUF1643 domain-containing protein [Gammaproteobacteria bacterium]
MKKSAKLSRCRQYRYALWRSWDDTKPQVMFIGLNPSTADETNDDPTLIRCINFAKSWGYGSICTANLFAFRATQPQQMLSAADPVGKDNDRWLKRLSLDAALVVAAWGNDGVFQNRSVAVRKLIPHLHYLKLNRSGEPAHPLYLRKSLKPLPLNQ